MYDWYVCFSFRHADDKTKKSVSRILGIWEERGVFEQDYVRQIKHAMAKGSLYLYWRCTIC